MKMLRNRAENIVIIKIYLVIIMIRKRPSLKEHMVRGKRLESEK